MQLDVDIRQQAQHATGTAESAQQRIRGLNAVDDGSRAAPAGRPYSFLADCECPADCLRDHENE